VCAYSSARDPVFSFFQIPARFWELGVGAAQRLFGIHFYETRQVDQNEQHVAELILYLRVPPREAQRLIAMKSARSYTSAQKDLQEASLRHLEDAAEMYDSLSRSTPWATIQCFDATQDAMREPEDIAMEVLAAIEGVLASTSAGEGR
jgi:thymidylate kinase